MKIQLKTIPHSSQRYETCGDYWVDQNGVRHVRISDMGNEDYEFLIGLHEQIEQHLCLKRGITEESISSFDIEYEKNRPYGDESEPGDSAESPYRKEHFFATNIERMIALESGVDWKLYDQKVMSL